MAYICLSMAIYMEFVCLYAVAWSNRFGCVEVHIFVVLLVNFVFKLSSANGNIFVRNTTDSRRRESCSSISGRAFLLGYARTPIASVGFAYSFRIFDVVWHLRRGRSNSGIPDNNNNNNKNNNNNNNNNINNNNDDFPCKKNYNSKSLLATTSIHLV